MLSLVTAAFAMSAFLPPPKISEIRVDCLPPVTNLEYLELTGIAGYPLDGLAIVVIGDADDVVQVALGNSGVVESVVRLDKRSIPADRAMLIHSNDLFAVSPDLFADLRLEDADNLTVLLVRGANCSQGDDLDFDDDGVLDAPPWSEVIDGVAIVNATPGLNSEWVYSPAQVVSPNGLLIFHVMRCLDTDAWRSGGFSYNPGVEDTAGLLNPPCFGVVCVADLDQDGSVDAHDIAILLSNWGMLGTVADLDQDGIVDARDLTVVLSHWGPCDL